MRIALVAGEASGDILGAGLIAAMRARCPEARFEGIAGPRMMAEGCTALFPSERLAVMGLVEVLRHLPELHRIRSRLLRHWRADPPDVFVGIDAPDFNLGLELSLRAAGVPTVHYVSPSVWAWRQYRVRKIARAADTMLTLLPFEARFYEEHGVPVSFVGHPLADAIPLQPDRTAARAALGLPADARVLALMPGSRMSEVRMLGETFVAAAAQLWRADPGLRICAPTATDATRDLLAAQTRAVAPELPVTLLRGQVDAVLDAADAALIASGTATLEAALHKCPMVVAYRLAPLTYAIARRLVKTPHIALPNLLAGRALVPEFIQEAVTPEALASALRPLLYDGHERDALLNEFAAMHAELRRDASARAAEAVLQRIRGGGALPTAPAVVNHTHAE